MNDEDFAKYLNQISKRVRQELNAQCGWWGDKYTPAQVRWNDLAGVTQYRFVHAHDIGTGQCMKNREGAICE